MSQVKKKNGSATLGYYYYYVVGTELHQLMSRRIGVGWARRGRSEVSKHTTFETETDFAALPKLERDDTLSRIPAAFSSFYLLTGPSRSLAPLIMGKRKPFVLEGDHYFP